MANTHAYVANQDPNGQLQIIDISDLSNPLLVATSSLQGVDPSGSYPAAISIFYYNSRVYVGTAETAGPEFHIFDVSNPLSPIELGQIELTHNVHEIYVKNGLAYLSTSANSQELIILDINDPVNITELGSFNAAGSQDSFSLHTLGNKLYLGRKKGNAANPELYILNTTTATSVISLGSKTINLNGANSAIVGIIVSGPLAFLATTDPNAGFQVWNISDPGSISNWSTFNYSEVAADMDFENNLIYIANRSNDALRIIKSKP